MGFEKLVRSGKLTWLAGKWTQLEDVFPIENRDYFFIGMLVSRSVGSSF